MSWRTRKSNRERLLGGRNLAQAPADLMTDYRAGERDAPRNFPRLHQNYQKWAGERDGPEKHWARLPAGPLERFVLKGNSGKFFWRSCPCGRSKQREPNAWKGNNVCKSLQVASRVARRNQVCNSLVESSPFGEASGQKGEREQKSIGLTFR